MSETDRETHSAEADLVCVFRTGDEGLAAIVKSILDGEGIVYLARNAGLQELFGVGRIGGGFNFVVGSVDFFVRPCDAERARAVLEALREGFTRCEPEDAEDAGEI